MIRSGILRLRQLRWQPERAYHITKEENLRMAGLDGVFVGDGGYEKAETDLEVMTVMSRTGVAPDGRRFDDVRESLFSSLKIVDEKAEKPRDGARYLREKLKGPEKASYYPQVNRFNPHDPFPLTPKQERRRAKEETRRGKGKPIRERLEKFMGSSVQLGGGAAKSGKKKRR